MAKQYIMKGLDAAFWQRVKEKALSEQTTVKDKIVALLTSWLNS